ncbi:hypothetical protein DDB_G0290523 [Dictyostelium discoideum AX4]|uniref:Transmembrane protein n=1 Tax=Dictyostelium discoideum TaxID=44689 RepID=Q54FZ2_DICDI|nr:hypothetical protein DDB_G0290523 [Dictyostelium discoideum AX4]EAL62122.1 hypothetical protein DDB_G0290523 [Dictyostelium discoideum AX4]|eukprot:XP_635625.1 hypothetical protein DDB_G0290523 [Dictyostelium discoideum AX4]
MESTENKIEKNESTMTLEERRREARKKRINSNTGDRLSFIQSHTNELKNDLEPKPIETKQTNNGELSGSASSSGQINLNSIFEQQRILKDPLSFSILRWIGIIFFALIFVSNSMLSCSPEFFETSLASSTKEATTFSESILQKYQWIFRILYLSTHTDNSSGKQQSPNQLLYIYLTLGLVWLVWEYILVYRNRKEVPHLRQKTFLSFARSDALLIAFVYIVLLDCILRFKDHFLPINQQSFIKDNYLISILYYPLIIAFVGQLFINYFAKSISILSIDNRIYKIYQGLSHFVLAILISFLCSEWWECSSCHCSSSYGLLWLISKSRGLLLWAHICINFISRILG